MSKVYLVGGGPGDPDLITVKGRGGEEAEALASPGIPFEVIPGITVPLGIAAYTGVPLTHRGRSSAVSFITGHDAAAADWSKLGHSDTLVIFMGMMAWPVIARE